ncbi:MAG: Altered inheritance of mitochondria protein 24, mitochondrial [Bogoriella megaspora]|nr:MAG: Altered inheritance of mitochondria protein 24, mitochondrial [Bogoriella megaspora]
MGIVRGMMESPAGRFLVNSTYIARRFVANASYSIRSWMRKYVWGDRLFLRFQGPSTILIQSRASRLSDVLTTRDVNEIAETPAGAVQEAIELKARKESGHGSSTQSSSPSGQSAPATTKLSYATIGNNKKVEFGSS